MNISGKFSFQDYSNNLKCIQIIRHLWQQFSKFEHIIYIFVEMIKHMIYDPVGILQYTRHDIVENVQYIIYDLVEKLQY